MWTKYVKSNINILSTDGADSTECGKDRDNSAGSIIYFEILICMKNVLRPIILTNDRKHSYVIVGNQLISVLMTFVIKFRTNLIRWMDVACFINLFNGIESRKLFHFFYATFVIGEISSLSHVWLISNDLSEFKTGYFIMTTVWISPKPSHTVPWIYL